MQVTVTAMKKNTVGFYSGGKLYTNMIEGVDCEFTAIVGEVEINGTVTFKDIEAGIPEAFSTAETRIKGLFKDD